MKTQSIISLLRPHQWLKNVFVMLPLFFGGSLLDLNCWRQAVITFFAFSFIASAIYCLNDICDIDSDRRHPVKCHRPLACGDISMASAYVMMACLIVISGVLCIFLGAPALKVACVLTLYFILNIAYCFKLKQYAIIDVFIISAGFVLRLVAGGISCDIWLSPWIISMTFLVALFLAFAKRRDDVVLHQETGLITRRNIVRYNIEFMNQVLGLIGAITIVCYIIYTVSPEVETRLGSQYVYVSSVFVLAGILRYLQVAIVDVCSGSPTKILMHDHFIQACVVLWIAVFIIILYL